jgi:hypothetical protein
MRKVKNFLTLFLLTSSLLFSFWNVEEGEPTGFRNYTWGMEISSLYLREFSRSYPKYDGKVVYYTKKNEDLKLTGAEVEKIEYGFWQDEVLCEILITIKRRNNYERIKRGLIEKYGKKYRRVPGKDRIYYQGKTTYISLEFEESNQKGYLFMCVYPMSKFIKIYENLVAKKGTKDF